MGVEYTHWLLPNPATYVPTDEQVVALIEALIRENWLPRPTGMKYPVRGNVSRSEIGYHASAGQERFGKQKLEVPFPITGTWLEEQRGADFVLEFDISSLRNAGTRYPLVVEDPESFFDKGDPYFCYMFRFPWKCYSLATMECLLSPYEEELRCRCGKEMRRPAGELRDWGEFYPEVRIFCPACGAAFDPSGLTLTMTHMMTGKPESTPGSTLYRFALVIDCDKFCPWPEQQDRIWADPELKLLIEQILGVPLLEVNEGNS